MNHQMQASASGLTPNQDTIDAYGRELRWSAPGFYYQSPTQGQQEQWSAGNGARLYR
jgi:hypothetical protein